MQEPITDGDLRDAQRRHLRLVVEDAPEVLAVGEDLGLQRQEGAAASRPGRRRAGGSRAAISWARRCFLTVMRVVGAALDGRVVGDDHAPPGPRPTPIPVTMPAPGASPSYISQAASGLNSRNGVPGSQRRLDALAGEQLAARAMPGDGVRAAPALDQRDALAQLGDQGGEIRLALFEFGAGAINPAFQARP